jgi:hypothetical protein
MEDYEEQEIENFMEELGVYDGAIEPSDPRWSTPLNSHVHAYLIKWQTSSHPLYFGLGNTPLKEHPWLRPILILIHMRLLPWQFVHRPNFSTAHAHIDRRRE